jgi:uncharacterized membrane protein
MIIDIVVGVIAFIAGILVGRVNKNKVETVVADVKAVEEKVLKTAKKL